MSGSGDEKASEGLRQQAIDRLCEAFADDQMSMDDFESRVELAHRAGTAAELRALLQGLPEASVPARVPETKSEAVRARPPAPNEVSGRNLIMGVLGGGVRRGNWTPAETNLAIAVMGGVELDLRDARLRPGEVTEIDCFALMGGVEVIVPPDVEVQCNGVGIMGGFEYDQREESTAAIDAPVLRINGMAMFGGVEITVRLPGESKRDAKRRRRADRHARRLLKKGNR